MARIVERSTGTATWAPDDEAAQMVQSGGYDYLPGIPVNLRDPSGAGAQVPPEKAREYLDAGWTPEPGSQSAERSLDAQYGGHPYDAFAEGLANGFSFGLHGLEQRGNRAYSEVTAREPAATITGDVIGTLAGPPGAFLGAAVAPLREAGVVGRAVAGGVEGAAYGAKGVIQDPSSPLTAENVLAGAGGGLLFGGATELAAAGATRLLRAGSESAAAAAESLARTTASGASPEGETLAAEIKALRDEAKNQAWGELPVSAESKRVSVTAAKMLGRLTNTPEALAREPWQALKPLEVQRTALQKMIDESPAARELLAKQGRLGTGGRREALLDALPGMLARNQDLNDRLVSALAASKDAAKPSLARQVMQGAAFTIATKAAAPLGVFAPLIGGKVASLFSGKALSTLGPKIARVGARVADALEAVAPTAARGIRAATFPGVEKALSHPVAPRATEPSPTLEKGKKGRGDLSLYRAREHELRSATTMAMDGSTVVRPEVRQEIGRRLRPIATESPVLADRLETVAARRIAYLSSALPKRPDWAVSTPGPDAWRPSDLEIAAFARKAHAVEDPVGVLERAVAGRVTPEEADAIRQVYPELWADFQGRLVARLGELRERLPYAKRLGLSILSGTPVEPAMNPAVFAVLQASFRSEPGTSGGTEAPRPHKQLSSVKADEPTPAQKNASS